MIGHVTVRRCYQISSFQSHDSSEFDWSIYIRLQSESREMKSQMNRISMNKREFFIWDSISRDSDCIVSITLNYFLNKFLSPPPPSKSNSSKRLVPPFVVGTSDWLFTLVGSDWILKSSNKFISFFVSTGALFTGVGTFSCVGCSEGDKVVADVGTDGSGATTGEACWTGADGGPARRSKSSF